MKRTALAMLTALVCTLAPLTIKQAYAQEADASAQFDQFSVFVGDWNCTGKHLAHGKTPAHATTARLHGEQAVGGQWILIRYDENKSAVNPKPFHVDEYFGYNSTRKQFVTVAAANSGYFSGASPGWSDNSITFDEAADGKSTGSRDTFTRNG
ncbi:MAG TPA: hypothetical protein VNF46_07055, partial [Gammaproteobacteria bacterium]|nr:hypothetical protein [Gammaproteobacteria bacterium]